MLQKLLGRGNVVLRKTNRGEELTNASADLGVTFQPSTTPEFKLSNKGIQSRVSNSIKKNKN